VEEVIAAQGATSSPEFQSLRIEALSFLLSQRPGIVVTSVAGLRYQLAPVADFAAAKLLIAADQTYDLSQIPNQLVEMGYRREKLVVNPGEFAIRGDIVDIYPLNFADPIRAEFFGDELDGLRTFDPGKQRSLKNLDHALILPATEKTISLARRQQAADLIQTALTKQLATLPQKTKADHAARQTLTDYFEPAITALADQNLPENAGLLVDFLYEETTTLANYLRDSGILVFEDFSRLLEKSDELDQELAGWQADQMAVNHLLPEQQFRPDFRDLNRQFKQRQLHLALFQKGLGNLRFDKIINVDSRTVQQFFSQMPLIKTELDRWHKQQRTVVLLIAEASRRQHLQNVFRDFEVDVSLADHDQVLPQQLQLVPGNLRNGFELPGANLVVLTEHELFNRVKKKAAPRRQTMANAERLRSYNELKPGDYVVHINHGIGRFEGMQTMTVDGVHRDYLTIAYQDDAKLFIPVDQLNLISKYVSAEGKTPRINRLGGSEWQKTKQKVSSRIEDIADDLIALYAKRQAEKGFAFGPDDDLQRQFESEFAYAETPDQLRSTAEVKHDMERPQPMDRLLVGDVGFGKTEVALRAAFKAVMNNKQVAFLVPTTILAQQHFDTMQDRFADFPINVGMMSRFQTAAENRQTIKDLKAGKLDIVVGTHRILSKDVEFADLGLLIVDEEQRFGVKHKERLKEMRASVDVLTLTATPIPRTLHMSMIGVRDLSVIETPPTNRYPIQTYVLEQNAGAVREAIQREIERGGQVFYLHNRVDDIERTVDQLQALIPEATIAYAHGQMTENQLENVIFNFVNGDYDILVTTTIIETGVDMPNANTLIVENADRYGLSQLYQLRGRVGRSSRIAYAYFMYQPNKVLTEVSEKRLQAIKDFTELGSGFKIAMRDLSIRGAGNLLGKQQHGFINSVGFDLYSQMLNEAVQKRQHKAAATVTDTELNLNVEAYLPDNYVDDGRQKIELYKRIRQVASENDLLNIQSDLIDRFGEYPEPVANLLLVGHLKMLADQLLLRQIRQKQQQIIIRFSTEATQQLSGEDLFAALSVLTYHADVKMTDEQNYQVILTLPKKMPAVADWLQDLIKFLQALQQTKKVIKK
jgi:transcription-repair coupling factor (mfd)